MLPNGGDWFAETSLGRVETCWRPRPAELLPRRHPTASKDRAHDGPAVAASAGSVPGRGLGQPYLLAPAPQVRNGLTGFFPIAFLVLPSRISMIILCNAGVALGAFSTTLSVDFTLAAV